MNSKLLIPILIFAFATQCSLTDRLAKASDKIAGAKLDIKAGKFGAHTRCNGGYCRDKCKSCKSNA